MRVVLAGLCAVLALSACHRDPPATTRPGQIVPLDPAGLARIRANADASRPAQPALRVLSWEAVISRDVANQLTADAISSFAPSLVRRLEALDAWSPRATGNERGAHLSFALSRATLPTLVREQLTRPGRIELYPLDACPKFTNPTPLPDVRWVGVDGAYDVPYVAPNSGGVAPLASLRAAFNAFPLPSHLQWMHGALRSADGEIARRGYCVRALSLRAPSFSNIRATLDPATLGPMLEVTLDTAGTNAYVLFLQQITLAGEDPPTVLLGIDGEVVGPVRFNQPDAGAAMLRVAPNSRMGSVSPELVGALWRSGPIAVPFTLEESAPPTS